MLLRGCLLIMLDVLMWPKFRAASLPLHMDSVIQILAQIEQEAPTLHPTATGLLLMSRSPIDFFQQLFLSGAPSPTELKLDLLGPELQELAASLIQHRVGSGQEHGVVLAPDGSTVAVEPLLAGLQVGLHGRRSIAIPLEFRASSSEVRAAYDEEGLTLAPQVSTTPQDVRDISLDSTILPAVHANSPTSVDNLLAVTLARALGVAFLPGPGTHTPKGLGPDGCWDHISAPKTFSLLYSEPPSALTVAFLNGALDGALLGDYLSRSPKPHPPLSHLLTQYYGAGVGGDPQFRSNFRRDNGAELTSQETLAQQVWGSLLLIQELEPSHPQLANLSQAQLAEVATQAAKEFTEAFLECPAILPRCRWEAAPYRGSPRMLNLPLGFLYVHHTYEPHQPCTSFSQCAADMRSMQRFHQDTRGWDDIGYSFVVGTDGYVYEGRGWHWVGAHTLGHNFLGFGVSIIGNYTATLPAAHALRTVRDTLPRCALRAGHLRPDYTMQGHRQLVHTDCPGDALYRHIRTWPRFRGNHQHWMEDRL
ncbi:N-acetylmuramoyl-L-alanine amidase isoform X1 [Trichosurus vulpecula]|uniref:N-acetylmuramoyl-L-alanine amidase isoform X1 n=1 Tax=Trichosurus vulpecula TaxID=9337 RepID=UPI00186B4247|nr:N-acetylmuramoyl-L-alanine amidase isoform X1 [Trichosurus vulpecula]XP_036606003.1 N-acetylmuramoyl-L-alanine amidase isoform X1 [Trichosurus vulpecula]